ncbi:hypothetical protein A0H81_13730 [Grifola frondosa]|uniref:Peptidase A1 domain-containing protein n=1 Tax=Grifola frondosa TaxID=5627 RepID=A0A1C7LN14_GRIFR|nr:hypothetical protein A0H81_13730 [Grifola frondosa]
MSMAHHLLKTRRSFSHQVALQRTGAVEWLDRVGSPYQSQVLLALLQANSSYKGLPFLDNVLKGFFFYPNESNYMTFLLSRSEIGITNGGVFTIAELDSDHANVTQAPKLNVFTNGGWTTFMDGVRINGELFTGNSVIAPNYTAIGVEVPGNSTITTLDTGTSYALAPPYYVDALYKNLPGAVFADNVAGTGFGGYYLPCNTKINASLVLSGQTTLFTPLTWSQSTSVTMALSIARVPSIRFESAGPRLPYGRHILAQCVFTFRLRKLTAVGEGVPFMQLLSVTDADKAWAEADAINLARLLHFDRVDHHRHFDPPPGPTTTDIFRAGGALAAVSTDASGDIDFSGLTRNTYIIMGLLGGVLVLLIVVAVLVARAAKANAGYKAVPNISVQPPAFNKPYESYTESYATPYSDGGH